MKKKEKVKVCVCERERERERKGEREKEGVNELEEKRRKKKKRGKGLKRWRKGKREERKPMLVLSCRQEHGQRRSGRCGPSPRPLPNRLFGHVQEPPLPHLCRPLL